MTDIILAGVGGQGTVLASKLLARAAMNNGLFVRTAETIGMAQRGGCVVTHVRIGDSDSSMIPLGAADAIISFEPGEAVRNLGYLKPDGMVITAANGVIPVTASLGGCGYDPAAMVAYLEKNVARVKAVDVDKVAAECGSFKVINVALLGAAARFGLGAITIDALEEAVREMVPPKFLELNLKALSIIE